MGDEVDVKKITIVDVMKRFKVWLGVIGGTAGTAGILGSAWVGADTVNTEFARNARVDLVEHQVVEMDLGWQLDNMEK